MPWTPRTRRQWGWAAAAGAPATQMRRFRCVRRRPAACAFCGAASLVCGAAHLARNCAASLLPSPQSLGRLFHLRAHHPVALRRLSMQQVEDFRQHGYVVVDNFITKEAAARVKADALRLWKAGRMQPLLPPSPPSTGDGGGAASAPASRCSSRSSGSAYASPASEPPTAASSGASSRHSSPPRGAEPAANSGSALTTSSHAPSAAPPARRASGDAPPGWPATAASLRRCEHRLQLQLGRPPADSGALSSVMVAFQELQVATGPSRRGGGGLLAATS